MMTQKEKLFNIPLCDLSLGKLKNHLNQSNLQSSSRQSSRRITNMQFQEEDASEEDNVTSEEEETSEEENLSPEEEETSEKENVTPEEEDISEEENLTPEEEDTSKEENVTPKEEERSEEEYVPSEEEETSEEEYVPPKKEKKVNIKKGLEDNEESEYEKMIQKNRGRRLAFLQSLQMDDVKEDFCKAVQSLKPKKRPCVKRSAPSTPPVLRKSRRLTKKDINLSERDLMQRAIAHAHGEIDKPQELSEIFSFENALRGEELFSNFVSDFSDLDCKKSGRSYEFMSHMKKMKVSESQIAKIVPGRLTAMSIHPVCDKIIITAGDSYGHVGLWNVNSDSNPYVFGPHRDSITNIMFNPYDSNEIVTASYDGRLCCGFMEQHVFYEVYRESSRIGCSFFDVLSKTTFIVGHRSGEVAIVDNRAKKSVKIHTCHDYAVKSLCVHPVDKNYFISSELKGGIRLWDLRKLQRKPVADIQHHRKCVSSAFFSPLTGNSILSTCADNSLGLFDSSRLSDDIYRKKSIKHKSSKHTAFKAIWVPNTDDTFVVGSLSCPRRIQVYNDRGDNFFDFVAEDLSSIISLLAFHPTLPVLAGGNYEGKVFVFTDTV